ncbi:hypothetical protein [Anaerocolumna aminovalerica]|nr:hypothetical protein [Anaerocolumna aminovalerica]
MGTTDQVKLLKKRITELEKENLILQEKVTFLTRNLIDHSIFRL